MANLNIKLVKSLNGRIAKHKATAEALGRQDCEHRLPAPGHRGTVRRCAK